MKTFTYQQYLDGNCTKEEYYNQFNPIKLDIGRTYEQKAFEWATQHFKIVYQDDNVSLGIVTWSKLKDTGSYMLFSTKTGFPYPDNRIETYQLRELKE